MTSRAIRKAKRKAEQAAIMERRGDPVKFHESKKARKERRSLDALNERLFKRDMADKGKSHFMRIHPTKGWQRTSKKRIAGTPPGGAVTGVTTTQRFKGLMAKAFPGLAP